eukprot:CAMPEP_0195520228 /NCGR_PEP_ID=MMETSP0794_2-20130614/16430_1 /TAXON_ID=515487 /ORGANISM="Stephanopyxis turris, Strain CCMP 815" /LENGTH=281 /DNA_ID=CAMNT_0040649539 /DNA_START=129 /DNA_END=974 /DNA_ORIENTATION=+
MDDFHAKASQAVSKMSHLNPAEILAKNLTSDTPKIDSAVKSYLSLIMARSLTASTNTSAGSVGSESISTLSLSSNRNNGNSSKNLQQPVPQTTEDAIGTSNNSMEGCGVMTSDQSLGCARMLLRAINEYRIGEISEGEIDGFTKTDTEETRLEHQVIRMVWNGLLDSKRKPSRYLGRQALLYAYPHILIHIQKDPPTVSRLTESHLLSFFHEFGVLLVDFGKEGKHKEADDDSSLLWAKDGGTTELAKRNARRKEEAQGRVQRANTNTKEGMVEIVHRTNT